MELHSLKVCGFGHILLLSFTGITVAVYSYKPTNSRNNFKKSRHDSSLCLPLTDMAVHNFVGDAFRGATWVALHNGGGVGW